MIGELESAIDGGPEGNEDLLRFLDMAGKHMHSQSRALICVNFGANYMKTLERMHYLYHSRLLDVIVGPAKEFMQQDIQEYLPRVHSGELGIFEKDGLWLMPVLIYELTKK